MDTPYIERFVNKNNLIVLNDKTGTRLDPCSGKLSCLDLSFSSPSLASKTMWKVMDNSLGSDHFPVNIQISLGKDEKQSKNHINTGNIADEHLSFKNISWPKFANKCEAIMRRSINPY